MEVWARLILYNFCSIITEHVVITQKARKHNYQPNYTIAYYTCHYFLRLNKGEEPPNVEGKLPTDELVKMQFEAIRTLIDDCEKLVTHPCF